MARYWVAFDGRWQSTFHDRDQAIDWANEVGDTGRVVHVIERRWFRPKLIASFPENDPRAAQAWRALPP